MNLTKADLAAADMVAVRPSNMVGSLGLKLKLDITFKFVTQQAGLLKQQRPCLHFAWSVPETGGYLFKGP